MQADATRRHAPATERARSQKGNALIEFALILPLFLTLLFGVIYYSVGLYNKTVLALASREGARAGAVYVSGTNNTQRNSTAITTASQLCQNYFITFGANTTPNVTSAIAGDLITVTATRNYTGFFIFSDLDLSSQTSMRIE